MSLSLIIKREFNAKVRNKSFIVMTFLSPILFVAMGALVGYLASVNGDEVEKIALYDPAGVFTKDFKSDKKTAFTDLSKLPLDKAKKEAAENYEGLIFVPNVADSKELVNKVEYISNDSPSMELVDKIEDVVNDNLTKQNLVKANIDYKAIDAAKTKAEVKLSKFSGEKSFKWFNYLKVFIGFGFGYLIMMFIIIYGNMVMRSVIEEKTNRIIEIIISSVKPFKLMMGKIIGTSLAGILQFLIWAVLGGILLTVAMGFFGLKMGAASAVSPDMIAAGTSKTEEMQVYITEILTLPWATMLLSFLIFFIGGFFLYSSIYASIGAAVDSETDSQQFLLPIILPLMLGVYVGFFTVMNDPHGTVATVFSMIPLTSPIVMMMRLPFGVPLWQIALSMAILFATFFGVVWFAAKIYRIGILMYGKKPTYKEIYKWLKY
ncbi:ABC transporter permease [Flavobacterium rivuli WB 3.3-2 = DSM 21788]|uniref:ABC transporter permease n=1 Tax=Flavobacterium rivuli WB 3.3-2 = DSM 21788 TaxID=1121895 RepID=A0A0A2M1I9_9FLAO|nr:ABC transporter permease [Flavobacterium rivuli]KGO86512.1 ABC transporter permease [Flavobacterium rivuli WB 3.3-2 = DSM 21788]